MYYPHPFYLIVLMDFLRDFYLTDLQSIKYSSYVCWTGFLRFPWFRIYLGSSWLVEVVVLVVPESWVYSLPISIRMLGSLPVWILTPFMSGLKLAQLRTSGEDQLYLLCGTSTCLPLIYFSGRVCFRPLQCSLLHLSILRTSILRVWSSWEALMQMKGSVTLVVWHNWFSVMLFHPWRVLFMLRLLALFLFSFLLLSMESRSPPCFNSCGSGVGFWVAVCAVDGSLVGTVVDCYVLYPLFSIPSLPIIFVDPSAISLSWLCCCAIKSCAVDLKTLQWLLHESLVFKLIIPASLRSGSAFSADGMVGKPPPGVWFLRPLMESDSELSESWVALFVIRGLPSFWLSLRLGRWAAPKHVPLWFCFCWRLADSQMDRDEVKGKNPSVYEDYLSETAIAKTPFSVFSCDTWLLLRWFDTGTRHPYEWQPRWAASRSAEVYRAFGAATNSFVSFTSSLCCLVGMYGACTLLFNFSFRLESQVLVVIGRLKCNYGTVVRSIFGYCIPSFIICNVSFLEQHFCVLSMYSLTLGPCLMALDQHRRMLGLARRGPGSCLTALVWHRLMAVTAHEGLDQCGGCGYCDKLFTQPLLWLLLWALCCVSACLVCSQGCVVPSTYFLYSKK